MYIFHQEQHLKAFINQLKIEGKTLGFVPTMGALHQGHLSLIEQAKQANDFTICSIFVNPTQFNNADDLVKYPRTTERDLDLLAKAGNNIVFLPKVAEIYPEHLDTTVDLDLGTLDKFMEGEHRPGHFAGVVQVVKRLLDIVQPHRLYMGQKDYQQYSIIRYMAAQLQLDVEVISCSIVREKSGLAMSSRNVRLTPEQRGKATLIVKTLRAAKAKINTHSLTDIKEQAIQQLNIPAFQLDYFEIVDGKTLLPTKELTDSVVACTAVFVGEVRLIDNMVFV